MRIPALLCLLAGLLVLGACAGTGSVNSYDFFIKNDTSLMPYGPEQTVPGDGRLRRGTRIRIIEGAGSGMVLIETVRGQKGYVSSSDIQFNNESVEGRQDKLWQNQY